MAGEDTNTKNFSFGRMGELTTLFSLVERLKGQNISIGEFLEMLGLKYSPKPKDREIAHQKLFADWVKAVSGNDAARKRLEEQVATYDQAVAVSYELAKSAVSIAPGVVLVDVVNKPLFDPGTLNALLEKIPECSITVIRKNLGPIAAFHGIPDEAFTADEFTVHEVGPIVFTQCPERRVTHILHGCQQQRKIR